MTPLVVEYGYNECRVVSGPFGVVRAACGVADPRAAFDPRYRAGQWDGYVYFFDLRTKAFPTGLLPAVRARAKKKGHPFTVVNEPTAPPLDLTKVRDDVLFGITLRPHQVNAVRTAMSRERGCLAIATNGGKTEIAAAVMLLTHEQAGTSWIMVVPNATLLMQTAERLRTRLGNRMTVGTVGAGKKASDAVVTVATYQTLIKGCQGHGPLADLLRRTNGIIIDEGHRTSSRTIQTILRASKARFRLAVSGSFDSRDEVKDTAIKGYIGPVIDRVTNKYLMDAGYSATAVVALLTDDRIYQTNHTAPAARVVWEHGVKTLRSVEPLERAKIEFDSLISDPLYNAWVVKTVEALVAGGFKPLVLSTSLDHLADLERSIAKTGSLTPLAVSGKIAPTDRVNKIKLFTHRDNAVLLGSSVFDEGVDCPAIGAVLLVSGGKSLRQTLQRVGRAVRAKTGGLNAVLVVDFAAHNGKYIASHSLERLAIYESEHFEIREIQDAHSWLAAVRTGWSGALGSELYETLRRKQSATSPPQPNGAASSTSSATASAPAA